MPVASLERFWLRQERYEILCCGYQAVVRATGMSHKMFKVQLDDLIKKLKLAEEFSCDERTLERFGKRLKGEDSRYLKHIKKRTGLLLTCEKIIVAQVAGFSDPDVAAQIDGLKALIADFHQEVGVDFARIAPTLHSPNSKLDAALLFIASQLFIEQDDLLDAAERLLPNWKKSAPNNPLQQNFICYRYDTRPGYIAKSFIRVTAPSVDAPFCRFKNYYKDDRKRDREVSGLILPTKTTMYFLGQIDGGKALKLMSFKLSDRPQDMYEGLLLSYADELIASRFVMVPTSIPDHEKAHIGVFRTEKLKGEIAGFKTDLKNYIEFEIDKQIFKYGKPVTQANMVAFVNDRLSENDSPILTYADGTAFEPASTDQYTFNSALRLRQKSEPNEE